MRIIRSDMQPVIFEQEGITDSPQVSVLVPRQSSYPPKTDACVVNLIFRESVILELQKPVVGTHPFVTRTVLDDVPADA